MTSTSAMRRLFALPTARRSSTALFQLRRAVFSTTSSSSSADCDARDVAAPPLTAKATRAPNMFARYMSLTKPRLSAFVVLSAAAGFAMAPVSLSLIDFGVAMLGTSLTIASANAGNQAMEVEYDKLMQRTRIRMLPRELLTVRNAVAFSALCGVAGTGLLYAAVNPVAAALAAGNIILYVFVYTPMKRIHWSNTWIGAVVGAIPPMIGWAAATGGTLGPGAWALAAVLYAWQIPHFISLSWTIRREYERGGYKMMSLNLSHKIPSVVMLWSLYALPLGYACFLADITTHWFAFTSLIPGIPLVLAAQKFSRNRSNANSRLVFRWTLAWLPAFLALMMVHKKEWYPFQLESRNHPRLQSAEQKTA